MRQQAHKWANAKEQVAGPMHFRRSSASFRQQNWAAVFVLLLVQTARIARAPLAESRSCGADGLWSRDLGGLCSPGRVFGAADRCDKWTHSGGRAEGCSSSASGGASERRAAGSIPAGASHSAGIQLVSADHAANGASARGGQQKDGVSHGCSLRRSSVARYWHTYTRTCQRRPCCRDCGLACALMVLRALGMTRYHFGTLLDVSWRGGRRRAGAAVGRPPLDPLLPSHPTLDGFAASLFSSEAGQHGARSCVSPSARLTRGLTSVF